MKKYIITAVAILLLTMSVSSVSAAFEAEPISSTEATLNTKVSPCINETQWYYRYNNGVLEKRLWSITEKRWLTDWIPA